MVTVQLFNFMKKDLTGEEFPKAALELDRAFGGGAFRKNVIPFEVWMRLPRPNIQKSGPGTDSLGTGDLKCDICGGPASKKGKYCPRCNRFIREETIAFRRWKRSGSDWMETTGLSRWSFILHHSDKAQRAKALKDAWNPERKGFACRYTSIILEEVNFHDPWYIREVTTAILNLARRPKLGTNALHEFGPLA